MSRNAGPRGKESGVMWKRSYLGLLGFVLAGFLLAGCSGGGNALSRSSAPAPSESGGRSDGSAGNAPAVPPAVAAQPAPGAGAAAPGSPGSTGSSPGGAGGTSNQTVDR